MFGPHNIIFNAPPEHFINLYIYIQVGKNAPTEHEFEYYAGFTASFKIGSYGCLVLRSSNIVLSETDLN